MAGRVFSTAMGSFEWERTGWESGENGRIEAGMKQDPLIRRYLTFLRDHLLAIGNICRLSYS